LNSWGLFRLDYWSVTNCWCIPLRGSRKRNNLPLSARVSECAATTTTISDSRTVARRQW